MKDSFQAVERWRRDLFHFSPLTHVRPLEAFFSELFDKPFVDARRDDKSARRRAIAALFE